MRTAIISLPIIFFAGCLSPETKVNLDSARGKVAATSAEFNAAVSSGASDAKLADLQAKLDKAESDLAKMEIKAGEERSVSFNAIVKAIVSQDWYTVATTLGSGILVGLGALKGRNALAKRKANKKTSAAKPAVETKAA